MSQHHRKSALAKFIPSRWLQSQFYKNWLKRCRILVSPRSPLSSPVWERLHISITWTCKEVCRMCSSHWWDCWDHESVGLFCPTWKIAWDLAVHLGSNCWVSLTFQAHPVSAVSSISSLSRASRGAASKRDRHAIFSKASCKLKISQIMSRPIGIVSFRLYRPNVKSKMRISVKSRLRKLTQGCFEQLTTRKLPSASTLTSAACYDSMTRQHRTAPFSLLA